MRKLLPAKRKALGLTPYIFPAPERGFRTGACLTFPRAFSVSLPDELEIERAASPVVSDDGKFIAFQMAQIRDVAGVRHGIFVSDIEKAARL